MPGLIMTLTWIGRQCLIARRATEELPLSNDSDPSTVTRLVPDSRPDIEVAAEIKTRMSEALRAVCVVMDDADKAGFVPVFNIGRDWAQRHQIAMLAVTKHY